MDPVVKREPPVPDALSLRQGWAGRRCISICQMEMPASVQGSLGLPLGEPAHTRDSGGMMGGQGGLSSVFFPGASLPCCLSTKAPALWNVKGPGSGRTPRKEADTPVTRTPAPRRPSLLPPPSPITRSFTRARLVSCILPCASWPLDLATSSGTWSRRVVTVAPGEWTVSDVGSSACSRGVSIGRTRRRS